jgi:hypothetical protein
MKQEMYSNNNNNNHDVVMGSTFVLVVDGKPMVATSPLKKTQVCNYFSWLSFFLTCPFSTNHVAI